MPAAARPPSLGLPFAAVGLVGGGLVARSFGAHPFDLDHGGALIALTTALIARRLGRRLDARFVEQRQAPMWWPEVIGRALAAGALNAVVLLAAAVAMNVASPGPDWVLAIFPGTVCAAVFGAAMAVPFIPSLLVVAAAHRRAGLARPGSVVGAALSRRVWLAVCVTVAMHVGTALLVWRHGPGEVAGASEPLAAALVLAMTGILLLLLLDGAALAQVRRAAAVAAHLQPADPTRPAPAERSPGFVDLGVGAVRFVSVEPGNDPYRSPDRQLLQLRGDPVLARDILVGTTWSDVVLFAFAMLPLGFLLGTAFSR